MGFYDVMIKWLWLIHYNARIQGTECTSRVFRVPCAEKPIAIDCSEGNLLPSVSEGKAHQGQVGLRFPLHNIVACHGIAFLQR